MDTIRPIREPRPPRGSQGFGRAGRQAGAWGDREARGGRGFQREIRRPYGSDRGSHRGSWRGRGNNWESQSSHELTTPPPPLGELVVEIKRDDISQPTFCAAAIENCEYVASYNWMEASDGPTVVIPGKPPTWQPPINPPTLSQDSGTYFRDINSAHLPAHPLSPAVHAVLHQNPAFNTSDIDVFTCASTLGNLSRFVRRVDREFRFVMQSIGQTVFFVRRERSPREVIPDVRGYGHTFPEAYTRWDRDVQGSVSNQRVIRYEIGGLRVLVRFEADGYLDEGSAGTIGEGIDIDDLADFLSGVELTKRKYTPNDYKSMKLKVMEGGTAVRQKDIVDIKTRAACKWDETLRMKVKKDIDMTDLTPRLWVSQIPTLIVAYHNRGKFDDIQVKDVRAELKTWEKQNETDIRRLVSLLRELMDLVRGSASGKLEVFRTEDGPLQVRRLADPAIETLHPELLTQWIGCSEKETGFDATNPIADGDGKDGSTVEVSDDDDVDYTYCSSKKCGYCGKCTS